MRPLVMAAALPILLAACGAMAPPPTPPSSPPALVAPPPVASDGFLTAFAQETIPMDAATLRRFMQTDPLIYDLQPMGSLSNPVADEVLAGTWPRPGAVRRLRLADSHYVIERVLENEPDLFRYQVYVFTNASGRGVEQIVGEQRFVSVPGGTRFDWTYNIRPRNFIARQAVAANLGEVQDYISNGLSRFAADARAEVGR